MAEREWITIWKNSLRNRHDLEKKLDLRREECGWFDKQESGLSLLVNPYFLELAKTSSALRSQCIPTEKELFKTLEETEDPLTEAPYSPVPRMVHRYPGRVAVLVTDQCALHCRHCFRRSFTGRGHARLTDEEIRPMTAYLKEHPQVREVLLTGGDPLTLDNGRLLNVIDQFRSVSSRLVLRLATRIPSVLPQRVDARLCRELSRRGPLWVITQFNHPDELTEESRRALGMLKNAGLPVMSQTVLLKGINDDADTLAQLFENLLVEGVKPYYLFQGDLAVGTSHFRTTLETGWQIMSQLRQRLSGLAMPVYAVDLPGGGGKIPLSESLLVEKNKKGYVFRNPQGDLFAYPDERSPE